MIAWFALLVMLAVQLSGLYSATMPGPTGFDGMDKLSHLAGFGIPAGLAWALGARWLVVLMVVHALVSEQVQAWLAPLRMTDTLDTVANLLGIGLAVLAVEVARRARARSSAMMEV